MSQDGRIVIRIQHLKKSYETPAGAFEALRDISLEIGPGEFVAINGKSGSGKSTLLNMLGGIDRPSSGSVVVGGTAIEAMSETRLCQWRGQNVGFVFQFFQLLPTLTAAENVMLPMDFRKSLPVQQRLSRALDLLDGVGVADQAGKLPATLSGGQQQRVAIARALANDPPVILADEPTGNLDSVAAEGIFQLFAHLHQEQGMTIVLITHDEEFGRRAQRTVRMQDGRVHSDVVSERRRLRTALPPFAV
jgi:putative ABC transport system ATP-binding protein